MKHTKTAGIVMLLLLVGAGMFMLPLSDRIMGPPDRTDVSQASDAASAAGTEPRRSGPDAQTGGTQATQAHGGLASGGAARVPATVKEGGSEFPVRTYKPLLIPNDPLSGQWWEADTRLPQMWDVPSGGNQTLLAVIDTGFALQHEEFQGRWHSNAGETGTAASEAPSRPNCTDRGLPLTASCNLIDEDGDRTVDNESGPADYENDSQRNCTDRSVALDRSCNLIDDDGNGYADDVRGWDFINYDNSPQAGELNPDGEGVTHGTAVAGVAAANGNNSKGIAGVNWTTKILPLQALDDDSYGHTLSVARAIVYAASQGADVISLSLGSDLPDEYVRQAVQTATAAGSVVVAASGNDGCACMTYPARYPEVVAVGALDTGDQPAAFSSWGAELDILAPGTELDAPTWTPGNGTSAYEQSVSGTSFAAPLVGGLLVRLASQQPDAAPLQLIAALTEQANRMYLPAQTAHDVKLGYGKLDAYRAASRMHTPRSPAQSHAFSPVSTGNYGGLPRSEKVSTPAAQACEPGVSGTTRLYEVTRSSTAFFTVSQAELAKAQAQGYAASPFVRVCMRQPHDTPESVRAVNLFREFRNLDKIDY